MSEACPKCGALGRKVEAGGTEIFRHDSRSREDCLLSGEKAAKRRSRDTGQVSLLDTRVMDSGSGAALNREEGSGGHKGFCGHRRSR